MELVPWNFTSRFLFFISRNSRWWQYNWYPSKVLGNWISPNSLLNKGPIQNIISVGSTFRKHFHVMNLEDSVWNCPLNPMKYRILAYLLLPNKLFLETKNVSILIQPLWNPIMLSCANIKTWHTRLKLATKYQFIETFSNRLNSYHIMASFRAILFRFLI